MNENNIQPYQEDRKKRALELDNASTNSLFTFFLTLKEINDDSYFIELGFETMAAYCKYKYDFAKSAVSEYLKVANKLLPQAITSNSNEFGSAELWSMPISKLQIIAKLNDSQIEQLLNKGSIKLGGHIYSIQDLKEMDRDSLRKLAKGVRPPIIKKESKNDSKTDLTPEKALDLTITHINAISKIASRCFMINKIDNAVFNDCFKKIALIYQKYITETNNEKN